MIVVVSNSVIILKIYATLLVLVIHVDFVLIVLSIILMVLMMTEFIKEILTRVKMFYKENEQKSRRVLLI